MDPNFRKISVAILAKKNTFKRNCLQKCITIIQEQSKNWKEALQKGHEFSKDTIDQIVLSSLLYNVNFT